MDTYQNPVYTQTNQGALISPSWRNQRGILTSHIVQVDSRVRNFDLFPNANHFKIMLPNVFHNVASVELLNACIPIVPNTPLLATDEHYVILRIPNLGTTDGALPTGVTNNFMPVFDDTFVTIPLIEHFSGTGFTFWRKDELRAIKYFEPRKSELAELEIFLEQVNSGAPIGSGPTPYPLANAALPVTTIPNASNDIKLIFEIVASN